LYCPFLHEDQRPGNASDAHADLRPPPFPSCYLQRRGCLGTTPRVLSIRRLLFPFRFSHLSHPTVPPLSLRKCNLRFSRNLRLHQELQSSSECEHRLWHTKPEYNFLLPYPALPATRFHLTNQLTDLLHLGADLGVWSFSSQSYSIACWVNPSQSVPHKTTFSVVAKGISWALNFLDGNKAQFTAAVR